MMNYLTQKTVLRSTAYKFHDWTPFIRVRKSPHMKDFNDQDHTALTVNGILRLPLMVWLQFEHSYFRTLKCSEVTNFRPGIT